MRILIQTSGGGGIVLIVVVALLAGGHGDVSAALAAVLIALAVVVALALVALVAFLVYRRRDRPAVTYRAAPVAAEVHQLPALERPALEQGAPHFHFHGVDAEDVAEILRRAARPDE